MALVAESLEQERIGEAAPDDFDGDALPELAVVTIREIHGAHAAARQLADDAIGSDQSAARDPTSLPAPPPGVSKYGVAARVRRQQRADVGPQGLVPGARRIHIVAARGGLEIKRRRGNLLDALPALRGGGLGHGRPFDDYAPFLGNAAQGEGEPSVSSR